MPTGVNTKLVTVLNDLTAVLYDLNQLKTTESGILSQIIEWQSQTNSKLESLRTEVADLQNVLGAAPGGPTTTVAGLLVQIANNTSCVQRACAPGGDDAEGCIEPLISYGQLESSDYANRVFATWLVGDLPDGLTEGGFLAHDVHNAQIIHTATIGWKAYVQSTGSASYSINPDSGATLSTNQWFGIDNWQDMAFSVPAGADIRVYLCNPTVAGWESCLQVASVGSTITTPGGSTTVIEMIPMSALSGVSYSDRVLDAGGGAYFVSSTDAWVATDNWEGVKGTLISGINVRMWWKRPNGSFGAYGLDFIGATWTIPEECIAAGIDSLEKGTATPFVVEVCPPELL